MCLILYQYSAIFIIMTLQYSSKSKSVILPTLGFFSDYFGYLGYFVVSHRFYYYFFYFCERFPWYFNGDCAVALDSIAILSIFIIPINKHEVYFHLLLHIFISFMKF